MIENKVIIWGMDDFNALGLLRELGEPGCDLLFLIVGHEGYASKSKYCNDKVIKRSLPECLDYLLETFKNEDLKPIVIASGDDVITFIDLHRAELLDYFILPGTSMQGDINKYIDKNTMTALAEEIGIRCPKSKYVQKDSDISGWVYPCLIKPSHQKPGHYNEFKFKICKNETELKNTLRFVRPDSEFILQEYVIKKHDLLVYGARMMDGETKIAGYFVRDRLSDIGSSSYGLITNERPVQITEAEVQMMGEYLERIDYYGLFSFEYGLTEDKAYFFEVNLRNDGTSHYFWQAGANIPYAYALSCAGKDYSGVRTEVTKAGYFIDEVFDYENVLHHRVSRKLWKKQREGASYFKYYDEDDMGPYTFVKKTKLKQMAQDIILNKFRVYIVFVLDKLGLRK